MKEKTYPKILTAIFTVFIFIMGALYIFLPKAEYSETEKRYLAQFPDFNFEDIKDGTFSNDFESYLSDHTPLRTFFVSLNAYYELLTGNNGSNGVYLGKGGMLIEKPADRNNRLQTNINRIKEFAGKSECEVYLLAVPEKGYIYTDYLPKNSLKYYDDVYYETINENLSDSNIKIIDIRDSFKANKDNKLYYFTDHHWTSEGAFTAYGEICKAFSLSQPETSDYDIKTYDGFYGTSYAKSCYTLTKPDYINLYIPKKTAGKAKVTIEDGKDKSEYDNLFFKNRLPESDKYLTFLDGNHSKVTIKTGQSGGKLLVIKDSYAHCLVPFLCDNYSQITMIDTRYFKIGLRDLIESENFDSILFIYGIENLATSRDIILNK